MIWRGDNPWKPANALVAIVGRRLFLISIIYNNNNNNNPYIQYPGTLRYALRVQSSRRRRKLQQWLCIVGYISPCFIPLFFYFLLLLLLLFSPAGVMWLWILLNVLESWAKRRRGSSPISPRPNDSSGQSQRQPSQRYISPVVGLLVRVCVCVSVCVCVCV